MSRLRPGSPPITQTTGFWELRAEQVMDRVFGGRPDADDSGLGSTAAERPAAPTSDATAQETAPPIDVMVRDAGNDADNEEPAAQKPATAPQKPSVTTGSSLVQVLLWGSLFCLPLLVLVGVLLRNLNHSETALNQERNLLLLERLRAINSTGQAPERTTAGKAPQTPSTADGLPPPPPNDDWMTELGQLPQSSAPRAEVLRVPPSSQITAAAPPASNGLGTGASPRPTGPMPPMPMLVGVIQAQGRGGAAIFQVDGASASAAPGEPIGNSGWRLRSANGDSAVIERGDEQRRLSISTGL